MYYGTIKKADIANGEGVRVSLFVSGCTNACPGCFQPETWDFHYGSEFTKATEDEIINELKGGYYQGLTVLGGEPFEPSNQIALLPFLKRVHKELPNRDIWMFTGNLYEDLLPGGRRYTEATDEILDLIDILVDGRFEQSKMNLRIKFRGSTNQRIIDMKKTRAAGEVVLSPLNAKGLEEERR